MLADELHRMRMLRYFEVLIGLAHSSASLKALTIGFRVGHRHPACKAAYVVALDRSLVGDAYQPPRVTF